MKHDKSSDTGYIVGSVLTTYVSTYTELKDRKEELAKIKSDLVSLDNKITLLHQDTQNLNREIPKLNEQLTSIEKTLSEMNTKLETVVSERKWYKAAAGFVIGASLSIMGFIILLISYSSEISAIKELFIKFIEIQK